MKHANKKAFTIVELVIVIAVIAILAAILIPTFSNIISSANDAKTQAEIQVAYTEFTVDLSDGKNDLYQELVEAKVIENGVVNQEKLKEYLANK